MSYSLRYHPEVLKIDLPKLDQKTAQQIGKAISSRLTTHPNLYGAPLRHTLKGYWKLRIGDYRVIYKILQEEVRVLAIIHRSKVYDLVPRRVEG